MNSWSCAFTSPDAGITGMWDQAWHISDFKCHFLWIPFLSLEFSSGPSYTSVLWNKRSLFSWGKHVGFVCFFESMCRAVLAPHWFWIAVSVPPDLEHPVWRHISRFGLCCQVLGVLELDSHDSSWCQHVCPPSVIEYQDLWSMCFVLSDQGLIQTVKILCKMHILSKFLFYLDMMLCAVIRNLFFHGAHFICIF